MLKPAEAAQHPEFGGSVPLGSGGGYALAAEKLPVDIGHALHYPSLPSLVNDLTGIRLVLFGTLRELRHATVEQICAHMGWEGREMQIQRELTALAELKLIGADGSAHDYVGLYSQLEITL